MEELPGCNVQERTLDEARESLEEAAQLGLNANRELAETISGLAPELPDQRWPGAG